MDTEVTDLPTAPVDAPKLASVLGAAALLTACGGGGSSGGGEAVNGASPAPNPSPSGFQYASPTSDPQAARFLLQAQFSASDADIAAVRSSGYAAWLQTQIASPTGQTGTAWLDSKGL